MPETNIYECVVKYHSASALSSFALLMNVVVMLSLASSVQLSTPIKTSLNWALSRPVRLVLCIVLGLSSLLVTGCFDDEQWRLQETGWFLLGATLVDLQFLRVRLMQLASAGASIVEIRRECKTNLFIVFPCCFVFFEIIHFYAEWSLFTVYIWYFSILAVCEYAEFWVSVMPLAKKELKRTSIRPLAHAAGICTILGFLLAPDDVKYMPYSLAPICFHSAVLCFYQNLLLDSMDVRAKNENEKLVYAKQNLDWSRFVHRWCHPWMAFCIYITLVSARSFIANFHAYSLTLEGYEEYDSHFTDGWWAGLRRDISDKQWDRFRAIIPGLFGVMILFCVMSHYIRKKSQNNTQTLLKFYAISGILLFTGIYGITMIFCLLWAIFNYYLIHFLTRFSPDKPTQTPRTSRNITLALVWIVNIAFLYKMPDITIRKLRENWGLDLSDYKGVMEWRAGGYFMVLKMLSYDLDLIHAVYTPGPVNLKRHMEKCIQCLSDKYCARQRQEYTIPSQFFSKLAYAGYVFYAPLFFAGPTLAFAGFCSHFENSTSTSLKSVLSQRDKYMYLMRWLLVFVLLELAQHYLPVFAVFNYLGTLDSFPAILFSPWTAFMFNWIILMSVYLKFYCIWRFFRMWALFDGIDPPENQKRCICNNHATTGFWQSWHASYNLWLIKYIYIPFGGAKNKVVNTFLVFTFVIFTHDPSFSKVEKYGVWGMMMAFTIMIETIGGHLAKFISKKMNVRQDTFSYRHVTAFGGIFSLLSLCTANMVAYGAGSEGTEDLLNTIQFNWDQFWQLMALFLALFSASHISIHQDWLKEHDIAVLQKAKVAGKTEVEIV